MWIEFVEKKMINGQGWGYACHRLSVSVPQAPFKSLGPPPKLNSHFCPTILFSMLHHPYRT
jgi:hypothetical protein